jgi:hypothetical protein
MSDGQEKSSGAEKNLGDSSATEDHDWKFNFASKEIPHD